MQQGHRKRKNICEYHDGQDVFLGRQNVWKYSVQGNTDICFVFRKNAIEKILLKVSEMLNGARLFQENRSKTLNLF